MHRQDIDRIAAELTPAHHGPPSPPAPRPRQAVACTQDAPIWRRPLRRRYERWRKAMQKGDLFRAAVELQAMPAQFRAVVALLAYLGRLA